MQYASTAVKNSLKQPLRERGEAVVTIDTVNTEIVSTTKRTSTEVQIYYATPNEVMNNLPENTTYATLEEEFFKVDGSMLFAPRPTQVSSAKPTGYISRDVLPGSTVTYTWGTEIPIAVPAVIVSFGDAYPDSVTIQLDDTTTDTFDVTDSTMTFEIASPASTYIKITPHWNSGHADQRFRIYGIQVGTTYVFESDRIVDTELVRHASPIGDSLPSANLSVELDNRDHVYDIDNLSSFLRGMSVDNTMTISYRYYYDGDNNPYECPGARVKCDSWSVSGDTATITGVDVLQRMSNIDLARGQTVIYPDLSELIKSAFEQCGFDNSWYDDPDNFFGGSEVTGTIPEGISCAEAVQLAVDTLSMQPIIGRDGKVTWSIYMSSRRRGNRSDQNYRIGYDDMYERPIASRGESISYVGEESYKYVMDYTVANDTLLTVADFNWRENAGKQCSFNYDVPGSGSRDWFVSQRNGAYYHVSFTGTDKATNNTVTFTLAKTQSDIPASESSLVTLLMQGHKYLPVQLDIPKQTVFSRGRELIWRNPLLDASGRAVSPTFTNRVTARRRYALDNIVYDYETRGDILLDPLDIVLQDHGDDDDYVVQVEDITLTCGQGFGGSVKTRVVTWDGE